MARTSDYSKNLDKDIQDGMLEESQKSASKEFKDIKKLFAKEPMTAEQFGIYLGGCKIPAKDISDKTIKRYIDKLCKMSNDKIHPAQFMQNQDGVDVYLIQPEFHELLVAMFDTDYFGAKGKPKSGVDVEQQLRAQLAENVEVYLSDDVKAQVKLSHQYLNARLESILSEKIANEIKGMLATIYKADDTIQYQLMLETMDRLVAIRRWMNEWDARVKLIKQEFAKTEQDKEDAKNNAGKFKHKQIQDIFIDVMAAIMAGEKYEYVNEDEEIFYPTLYAAVKMYDITAMPEHELTLWLEEAERNISNSLRYRRINHKAHLVFDENDLLEGKILESIDKIARTQIVSDIADLSPEQYERLNRFMGDASIIEKEAILCKIEQTGDLSLDDKTLQELIDIKDGVELKKKFGMI